jgi:hypothetical protein
LVGVGVGNLVGFVGGSVVGVLFVHRRIGGARRCKDRGDKWVPWWAAGVGTDVALSGRPWWASLWWSSAPYAVTRLEEWRVVKWAEWMGTAVAG